MSWGVQLAGAAAATMLLNLEIVFTLPLAAAVLGEALDARRLIGAAMVLVAVVASQWLSQSAVELTG
jgi:drug/metabolite transporter (DMT)-like permease